MDFPVFFNEWLNNRALVGVTAVIHVLINHPIAVGAYPLIAILEWYAIKKGIDGEGKRWDDLARRITFTCFIITTTVGAMTGVGIWLTTSITAPFAIGSLLRIFFWAWLIEWGVFITEVLLIMVYQLTWKRWSSGRWKLLHNATGFALAGFSWITMAIIVAVLAFQMDSGAWSTTRSFFSAVLNPLYLPQLAFRTTYAMVSAGLFAWFCVFFFTKCDADLRHRATRGVAAWTLAWIPPCALAAWWYWSLAPSAMKANVDVGLMTQAFSAWHTKYAWIMAGGLAVIAVAATTGFVRPRWVPRVALLLPFVLAVWMLGHFERVREFIRKPYVIAGYMYSNGVRVDELPIFQRDGILYHSAWAKHKVITEANQVSAGEELFLLTCTRCHTVNGVNGVVAKLTTLFGDAPWEHDRLAGFVQTMHQSRTYMPPFPGSPREAEALAAYLRSLQPPNAAAAAPTVALTID